MIVYVYIFVFIFFEWQSYTIFVVKTKRFSFFVVFKFVCLIGGRVCNPRQQQNALNIYNLLLPRVTNPPPN